MRNMKVAKKLIVGFLLVVALTIIVGVFGGYGIHTMDDVSSDMYLNKARPLGDLTTATEYFQRIRVQVRNAILYTGNPDQLGTIESDLNNRFTQFEASMNSYQSTLATAESEKLFNEIMDQYNQEMRPGVLDILNSAKQGLPSQELLQMIGKTTAAADIISNDLSALVEIRMDVMSDANDASTSQGGRLLVIIIVVVIICVILSMILALYISGLISKPLITIVQFLQKASSTGDLTLRPEDVKNIEILSKGKDEIGVLSNSLAEFLTRIDQVNKALETIAGGDLTAELALLSDRDSMGQSLKKMNDSLNSMFGEINVSTSQVSVGAKQIADGAQALAAGSTEQAASVEQLSSSIFEIAEKTKANARMALQAAGLADTIKLDAEKGSQQMGQMMEAVKEINQASQNINKVIKVIDDIAFQTNILALNAAVEAARAGQHGKGFAVVAEEVRSLAAKSAEAAKGTGELIANSMEKADLGVRIADETSASFVKIVTGINESSQIVSDIARSSEEQTEGIIQINQGIDQVAQVVQQNSATAEESAAASEEMSGQSSMLEQLVSQFKLRTS